MTKLMQKRLKTSLTVSAVLVAAFLAGCASKIDTMSEQKAVNEFVAKANIASNVSVADETNWWKKLNSDQLNELVTGALANNYNLQTSQLTLKSALARLGEQKAQYLPQGGVNVGAARSDRSVFLADC